MVDFLVDFLTRTLLTSICTIVLNPNKTNQGDEGRLYPPAISMLPNQSINLPIICYTHTVLISIVMHGWIDGTN